MNWRFAVEIRNYGLGRIWSILWEECLKWCISESFLERRIIMKLQNCLFMEFDIGRVC